MNVNMNNTIEADIDSINVAFLLGMLKFALMILLAYC